MLDSVIKDLDNSYVILSSRVPSIGDHPHSDSCTGGGVKVAVLLIIRGGVSGIYLVGDGIYGMVVIKGDVPLVFFSKGLGHRVKLTFVVVVDSSSTVILILVLVLARVHSVV